MKVKYSAEELEEIRRFMQPVAPSVAIAKQFRNEGGASNVDDPQQQQQVEDPFAGIDLDSLPQEQRDVIVAARTKFATLQSEVDRKEQVINDTKQQVSKFQSLADQRAATLQKHNLLEGGQGTQPVQQTEEDLVAAEFIKLGLAPDVAKAQAKLQVTAIKAMKPAIFNEIGQGLQPTIQNVAAMAADSVFEEASSIPEYKQYLNVPDIATDVRQTLRTLSSNGTQLDKTLFETVLRTAVGGYQMKNPQGSIQQHQPQGGRQSVFGGSRVSTSAGVHTGGGFATMQQGGNGAPSARNEDTARAIQEVTAAMTRGMKTKGGK